MHKLSRILIFILFAFMDCRAFGDVSPLSPTQLTAIQHFLVIPSTVAYVSDASLAPQSHQPPDFILIQDVHKHTEVQSEIASLILLGYQKWGVRKVFLEGAFVGVDLSVFHRLPEKTRNSLLNRLIKDGNLSGAELASVLLTETEWSNPQVSPFQLFGMEDASLYRQNVVAYKNVLLHRKPALQQLASLRRLHDQLNIEKPNIMTEQLARTEALIRLKITPTDYKKYFAAKEAIPSSPELDAAINAAEEYYNLVDARSYAFLKQVHKRAPAAPGPRILVVGGFHTQAMALQLRQKGATFVVLTPHVTQTGYEPLYEERMQENASALAVPRDL